MPTTYDWIGTTSGDFEVTTNWSPNGTPVTDDTIRFRQGSRSLSSSVDQSDQNFAEVYFGPQYSGTIASASGYFTCGATLVTVACPQNVYLSAGATSFDFDDVVVRRPWNNQRLFLQGTIGQLHCKQGRVTYESGTATEVWVEARRSASLEVTLTNGTMTAAYVMGNTLTVAEGATGTIVTLTAGGNGIVNVHDGTVTNLRGWGSRIDWRTDQTCVDAVMYAGTLDASQDGRAKVFTDLETHEGCAVDLENGPNNVTVTNGILYIGGNVRAPSATFKAA